jgi:DNA-binding winged helix-turn-helix (wHTH) protein
MPKNRKADNNVSQPLASLNRWLNRRGLTGNPFERWNAENDMDLPTYFVDIGNFDEFSQLRMPSIIFAQRGCGKTAQKQMVATECRPLKTNSMQLAISYTYNGFERVLESVNYDIGQIRPQHYVNALLYLGLTALNNEVKRDSKLQSILKSGALAPQWNAYVSHFAPHLAASSTLSSPIALDKLSSVELLQGFISLLTQFGLETCVVLVDGLDEFIYTSDPGQAIKFLAPLLGTLSIIECPGFAFKFFLPKELESLVLSCNWFRRDRIHIIPISWEYADFLNLIEQRLIYFSRREPKYSGLAELCDDELGAIIDKELILLAGNLPRNVLIMTDKLLRLHCNEPDPPELIKLETWKQVKEWWSKNYENAHQSDIVISLSEASDQSGDSSSKDSSIHPVLLVDELKGTVHLGKKEIRSKLKGRPYSMLLCLYKHRGEVCNKDMIVENVWREVKVGEGVTDQNIAAVVSRLRGILKEFAPNSEYIETITGQERDKGGYRLVPYGFSKDVT